MTLAEVKQYLQDNAQTDEVKAFLGDISKTSPEKEKEIVENYKKSPEFKKELQTEGDRRATGAVEKFQKETMPKHIDEEIKKRFPDETPEQKRMRELEAKLESITNEKSKSELREKTFKTLSESGMSQAQINWFMKYGNIQDEETISNASNEFKEFYTSDVLKETENKIKASGSNPPNSRNQTSPTGKITDRNELKNMKPEDIIKAQNEGRIEIPGINLSVLKEA